MRYENLLTRSLKIVWRKPWLWLLALLAGETSSGSGGAGSGNFRSGPAASSSPPDLGWVPGWLQDRVALFLEIAAIILVVGVVLFLISCLASGALVAAVARIDAGERVSFGAAWRLGLESYWRVLGFKLVQVLLGLLALLVLLLAPLAGVVGWGSSGLLKGLLLDLPLVEVSIAWLIFVSALSVLGLRACVLEGAGPIASFGAAYGLLKRRFSRIAMTVVVFVAAGIAAGVVLQVVLALVAAPFTIPLLSAVNSGRWSDAIGTFLAEIAVLLPVSLILSAAAGAYFATAWTVAYRRFDHEGEVPEPEPLAA